MQDTTYFINKSKTVKDKSKDSTLVTLEVRGLYTNIPNHETIEGVKETVNKQTNKLMIAQVIIKFFYLVLTLNNFIFDGNNHLYIKGCAMSTICAPAYVNISMGKFKKLHIYPYIITISTIYCGYIDDIFLWDGIES